MSGDDAHLDRTLREALNTLSAARGACPDRADLLRFHSGELNDARAAEIKTHAVRCAACDLALDRMERFDGAAADEQSIRLAISTSLSRRRQSPSRLADWWKPALAGAVAAGVLLSIPMLTSRRSEPAAPSAARTNGQSAELAQVFVIPQERDASAASALHLGSGEKSVVLGFFAPMVPGLSYTAKVVNQAGVPVTESADITSESQTGRVNLVVKAETLTPGSYRVEVSELTAPGQQRVLEALPFDVVR